MVNDTNNSKLDQAVKEALNAYEAPQSGSDWARMESMLESTPTSGNFKWSYSIAIFIGLIVLGGTYLLYHSKSTPETLNDPIPEQPIENTINEINTKPLSTPAASSTPSESIQPIENNISTSAETPVGVNIENVQKETVTIEKTKAINTDNSSKIDKEKKSNKKLQIVNPMGNEPIFGDMLDSSKGIVGKTKEKEETKKAAKTTKPDQPIGWGSFLSQNLDSLKKYQEQQQKDSIK